MKKTLFIYALIMSWFCTIAQNVGINATATAPDPSAMLDVAATDKGILVPRVALTSAALAAPITSPATSLLVYNTATAGVSPNNVVPGYYYWDGTKWQRMISNTFLNNAAVAGIGKFYANLAWAGNWPNNTFITFTVNDPNIVFGTHISQISPTLYGAAVPALLNITNVRVSAAGQFLITIINQSGGTLTGSINMVYTAFY